MTRYSSWSDCDACGFQGLMEFRTRDDENYEDPEALGVMMDCRCPACGAESPVLMVMEEYEEILRMSKNVEERKGRKE